MILSTILLVFIAVWSLNTGVYDFGDKSAFEVLWKVIVGDSDLSLSDKYIVWDV